MPVSAASVSDSWLPMRRRWHESAQTELEASGRVTTAVVDLTDEAQVAAATPATLEAHRSIDILANNAGITGCSDVTWTMGAS